MSNQHRVENGIRIKQGGRRRQDLHSTREADLGKKRKREMKRVASYRVWQAGTLSVFLLKIPQFQHDRSPAHWSVQLDGIDAVV